MARYAKGRNAYGFCDRCSQRYDLDELRYEYYHGQKNGLRVCPECWDEDHPQLFLDEVDTFEPIALRDPRPDRDQLESRKLYGFGPGTKNSVAMKLSVGKVTVTTT